MKRRNAIWLCAILTLSVFILSGQDLLSNTFATPAITANELRANISNSPEPTKLRMIGAGIFSFAITTAIIVISREIKLSRPKKQKILSKYYRT